MNKLDKYITVNYIKSFFLGMMMFFLIFLLAESINLTGWIMDKKFTAREALKYLGYGIPEIITNTAPLGVLLGSLLCISKMAKQLEITAMKTMPIFTAVYEQKIPLNDPAVFRKWADKQTTFDKIGRAHV